MEEGLEKLKSTSAQVDDLKDKLAAQEVELKQKNKDADQLIEKVGVEQEKVGKEKAIADAEEKKVAKINEDVSKKAKDCERDLAKAEPALKAAGEALNTLNKANLTELKSFGKPPPIVVNVVVAVMVLSCQPTKIPKDRNWLTGKNFMGKVDQFLDSLINFDKENINDANLKAVRPYLNDPEFVPDNVRDKSLAAAGLCSWAVNIVRFYEVFCDVEPKRKALATANAELAAAQDKLSKIKVKIREYHPKFRMILQTKLANPHYKPEMQAQATLINFTVTRDGLEDQLLAEVVATERPDLERTKAELTRQQNEFKIKLKELEDNLLSRLSSAGGNFLGDTALVENLETTKKTAQEIEAKVAEAKITEKKINEAREHYRQAATRASLLYFILNDLCKINPLYQFSLKVKQLHM